MTIKLSRRAASLNRHLHPAEADSLLRAVEMYPMSGHYVVIDERTGKPCNIDRSDALAILAKRGMVQIKHYVLVPKGAEPTDTAAVATFDALNIREAAQDAANYIRKRFKLPAIGYQSNAMQEPTCYTFRLPQPLQLREATA